MASFLNHLSHSFSSLLKLFESPQTSLNRPKLEDFISGSLNYKEKKNYYGIITSMCQGEGIVGKDIYFTVDSGGGTSFKLGDRVQGEAVRKDSTSAWRVIIINPFHEDWEVDEDSLDFPAESNDFHCEYPLFIIGKIVSIHRNMLALNTGVTCYLIEENCEIKLIVGDWIRCLRKEGNTFVATNKDFPTSKITPLRRKTIQGSISYTEANFFLVNGEVYCQRGLLPKGARLKDEVVADVIESSQANLSWRAVSVVLRKSNTVRNMLNYTDLSSLMVKPSHSVEVNSSSDFVNISQEVSDSFLKGVLVQGNFSLVLKGKGYSQFVKMTVKNLTQEINLILQDISIDSSLSEPQLMLNQTLPFPLEIYPQHTTLIVFTCLAKLGGSSEETVVLQFVHNSKILKVKQVIRITVSGLENMFRQKPVMPPISKRGSGIIRGEKPIHASPFIPIKLPRVEVPLSLWEAVLSQNDIIEETPILDQPLNINNYIKKFSTLLYLEEIEMDLQMSKFDIPCTIFEHHGEFLSLTVEGLSEKRPSLVVGDSVIASAPFSGSKNGSRYEGIIHKVLHSKVLVKFHPNFHSEYGGEDYAVELQFNRTPLRRCHLALSQVVDQLGADVLFPTKFKFQLPQTSFIDVDFIPVKEAFSKTDPTVNGAQGSEEPNGGNVNCLSGIENRIRTDKRGYCLPVRNPVKMVAKVSKLCWFNKDLNLEQKYSVKRILEGATRPIPYVIFGPPGTGKTITIVEAILQIYTMVPHSRLLVVSPSNSASDLVAERAVASGDLKAGELIRLNAFNRDVESIPAILEPYCAVGSNLDLVVRHRIIIVTASTAGLLYTAKLRNGHFTHVFVDEAGQLTEPEAAIALGLVNSASGQIVLAGDPKQLGPVVMSRIAKRFGLGTSLLHRLCSSVLYQPQTTLLRSVYSDHDGNESTKAEPTEEVGFFEPRIATLLVKNYRSHPDLLALPSRLFYHSCLQPAAINSAIGRLLSWDELPNPSCPLVFHPVRGENCQEGDSPSWFNPAEAFQVSRYTASLLRFGVDPSEVGIIAPYKKQVEKIRQLLAILNTEGVKVGTVEEFQGQEKLAIIVSTVRSAEQLVELDVNHHLGFLRCSQRFNVAMTRAIGLLIVIGNPIILAADPNWKAFVEYCVSKGAVNYCKIK